MTSIIMLRTAKGCENGFTVREYLEAQQYDVNESLARTFINDGAAFLTDELGNQHEEKAINAAPENKAVKPGQNKGSKK